MPDLDAWLLQSVHYARPFVVGGVAGAVATMLARSFARRIGFVALPNAIVPQHRAPVPYLGGVGVALGGGIAILLGGGSAWLSSARLLWCLPFLAFLILGLVDDANPFQPGRKFLLQLACAVLACLTGWVAPITGIPLLDGALSCAWIITVVNAVNVTDVCDGLVAGLGVTGLLALAVLVPDARELALIGAGACGGFLLLNRPPATIYLGDAGSHLIGSFLAAAGIACVQRWSVWPGLPCAALLTAVPLFEVLLLVTARRARGIPWWRGSPDHLALRLQAAGFSKWSTDALAWSAGGLLAVEAVVLPDWTNPTQVAALAATCAGAALCGRKLLGWEVRRAEQA